MSESAVQTSHSFDEIRPEAITLPLMGLADQFGVGLIAKDSTFYYDAGVIIPAQDLPVLLETNCDILRLTGLAQLVAELRDHLLDLTSIADTTLNSPDKIGSSRSQIATNETTTNLLFNSKPSILNRYITNFVRINLLIEVIDRLPNEHWFDFGQIHSQLRNWQCLLREIQPLIDKTGQLQSQIDQETIKQRGNNDSEVKRLLKLLSGERSTNRPMALKHRVMAVLSKSTSQARGAEVHHDLMTELFTTASVINEIRLIERLKQKHVDLSQLKRIIDSLNEEYEQHPNRIDELCRRFVAEVAQPIAVAVNALFPHASDNSPTLIADILFKKEAVCAGKVQIIIQIFNLLGVDGVSSNVFLTNSGSKHNHTVFSTQIFDSRELVIDANFKHPTAKDQRLVYTGIKVPEKKVLVSNSNIYLKRSLDGEDQYFQASIPNPHPIILEGTQAFFSSAAHNNYARFLEKQNRVAEAEVHYREALRLDPNYANAHHGYARFLEKQNRVAEAEVHYREALRLDPNYANAHHGYALVLEKQNRVAEAEMHYREALSLDPNYANAHHDYALVLEKQNRLAEAEVHYREALMHGLNQDIAWFNTSLGYCLRIQKRYNEASGYFQQALRLMKDAGLTNWLTQDQLKKLIAEINN